MTSRTDAGRAPDWILRLEAELSPGDVQRLRDAFDLIRREAAAAERERIRAEVVSAREGWGAAVELATALQAVVDAVQAEWDSADEEDDGPHNRSLEAVAAARAILAEPDQ